MIVKRSLVWVVLMCLGPIAFGCYPVVKRELKQPQEPLKPVRSSSVRFEDDMDRDSLALAIRRNLEFIDHAAPKTAFHYGADTFSAQQVSETQKLFLDLLEKERDPNELNRAIRSNFDVYRAAGRADDGRMLFTGYYEPVYEGSLAPDSTFTHPLYRTPDDLIKIDLSRFGERFKGQSITARIEGKKLVPYYSRHQIEAEKLLEGKGLEIVWLKSPVDVTFLHIQGSGKVRLADGKELSVHYDASNGLAYRSIGRYMIDKGFLAREKMSMQAIRSYLTEHPQVREEVLDSNPSYVFFRETATGPTGSLGVLLTPGRSIALDPSVFPKGALGFISCQKPIVNEKGEITAWVPFFRFVLNQDSGGAIKGTGRADIFWGSGAYAELAAGYLQHPGDLYLLIKKDQN